MAPAVHSPDMSAGDPPSHNDASPNDPSLNDASLNDASLNDASLNDAAVFRSGLATGDVDTTSVVLWTRAVPPTGEGDVGHVRWSLWTSTGEQAAHGIVDVGPEHDHTCHVRVEGLRPGTTYHVVCEAFGDRITGRTATLPTTTDRLRVAVVCCSRWGWPGFEMYGWVADDEPDVVLHLGDYIYETSEPTPTGRIPDPPHDCVTLDDYRRRHAQYHTDEGLRRLHAERPFFAVWDDHEVTDNAPDDETVARRNAGVRAWREWMPVDPELPTLDRVRSIGGLVDLVVVDARFGGRSPADTDGPSLSRAEGPILSDEQWHLVERAVDESEAPWFVFANQVQVSPMTLAYAPALRWPPWRRVVNPDQWDGFPADRDRLVGLLRRVKGHPIVVSGDLHAGWSRAFLPDGDAPVAHEFTSPSISGETYAAAVRERTSLPESVVRAILTRLNPGIDHLDLGRHGYLLLDIAPESFTTTFVHHDGSRVVRRHDIDAELSAPD